MRESRLAWLTILSLVVQSVVDAASHLQTGSERVLYVKPTSLNIKAISNYSLTFDVPPEFGELNEELSLQIQFDRAFMVWLSTKVDLRSKSDGEVIGEAELETDNCLTYTLTHGLRSASRSFELLLVDIVNPKQTSLLTGLNLTLRKPSGATAAFSAAPMKFLNKLHKLTVHNPHTEFIPGFYSSRFTISSETSLAYEISIQVITDSELITPEPSTVVISPGRLVFENHSFVSVSTELPFFRLKIDRNAPLGRYGIRFNVQEDNDSENCLKIERVEFNLALPESSYSVQKPKPFNGPKPEIKFSSKNYFAALGGVSALKFIWLDPAPTESFPLEIKTILPFQADLISFFPKPLTMTPTGISPFYIAPSIGSVSGNLHLHIGDLYYKSHVVMKEKKANIDITYHDIESQNVHLFLDERPEHSVNWLSFSQEAIDRAVARGLELNRSVEQSVQLVINHQVMVFFLFAQHESCLQLDAMLHKKLLDVSPLLNHSIVELSPQLAAYVVFPEYSEEMKGFKATLQADRREFLPFLDFKVFLLIRDGSLNVQLMDSYYLKAARSDLSIIKMTLLAADTFSKKSIFNYLTAFGNLKADLVYSAEAPADSNTETDQPAALLPTGIQRHTFLLLSHQSKDRIFRSLEQSILSPKNLPTFSYYLFLERGLKLDPDGWLKLEAFEEVDFDDIDLEIHLEDVSETMLHFSLNISAKRLGQYYSQLDFIALVQIKELASPDLSGQAGRAASASTPTESRRLQSTAIFDKSTGFAEVKYQGLKVYQEYYLKARACVFNRLTVLCKSKEVASTDTGLFGSGGHAEGSDDRRRILADLAAALLAARLRAGRSGRRVTEPRTSH